MRAIGCIPDLRVDAAAKQLYESYFYENELVVVRLMAVAREVNDFYQNRKPKVVQITWHHVLSFIHGRFHSLRMSKANHGSWPEAGQLLWEMSDTNADEFYREVLAAFQQR